LEKFSHWFESIRSEDLAYLVHEPYLYVAAVALGLLLLWLLYRLRPRRKIKAFRGDTGPVEISRHALLDLVRSACEQLPEVRKPSIRIRARRKLNLSVRIRVDGSARLRDTASFLQNTIKDTLENNLGVEKLGKIQVMVTGMRMAATPKTVDLNPRSGKTTEEERPKPAETAADTPVAKAVPTEKPFSPNAGPMKPDPRKEPFPKKDTPASPLADRPNLNQPAKKDSPDQPEKVDPGK